MDLDLGYTFLKRPCDKINLIKSWRNNKHACPINETPLKPITPLRFLNRSETAIENTGRVELGGYNLNYAQL